MFRKLLRVILAGALIYVSICPDVAYAKTKAEKQAEFAEKVRAGLQKLGAGEDTRVQVKLRNKTKLTGYVSEIRSESFVITHLQTGQATQVIYADVAQVKGQNLTKGQKIGIGVGVVAAVLIVVLVVVLKGNSGSGGY